MHGVSPAYAWRAVNPIWLKRSRTAADWLNQAGASAVADIGCGAMALRDMLRPGTRYIASDVAPRADDTVIVDLNAGVMPAFDARHVSMLGVFEYLDDVPRVLQELRQFEAGVVSYCHRSLWRPKARPHWRNHFTRLAFRRLLRQAGFRVVRSRRIRIGEMLYMIERV